MYLSFADVHQPNPVGAELAREGGLTADQSLTDVRSSTVGAGLARDGGLIADQSPAGVHIHSCGNGRLGFRPDGDSLWQTPQRKQRSSPQASGTSPRLGVPSLRCPSGGIAYGLLRDDLLSMCPAAPYGAARPPPDEHLHSACRRGGWIKINSGRRANARPVEWWGDALLCLFAFLPFLWEPGLPAMAA